VGVGAEDRGRRVSDPRRDHVHGDAAGDASWRELGLVAKALVASGDEQALEVLEQAMDGDGPRAAFYREAEKLGANPFVVLDLITATGLAMDGLGPGGAHASGKPMTAHIAASG
jgi:hypothetical protein